MGKKLTVYERIETLLDKGSFTEVDKYVKHRCTDFGMENKRVAGDGVVCGYGKIDGRTVYVYAFGAGRFPECGQFQENSQDAGYGPQVRCSDNRSE